MFGLVRLIVPSQDPVSVVPKKFVPLRADRHTQNGDRALSTSHWLHSMGRPLIGRPFFLSHGYDP